MRKRTAGRIVTAAMLAAACVMGGIAYRDITHETGMEATYAEDAVRKASEEGATVARKHPTMESVTEYAEKSGWEKTDADGIVEKGTGATSAGYIDSRNNICHYFVFFSSPADASPYQEGMKTKWKSYSISQKTRSTSEDIVTAKGKGIYCMSALYQEGMMISVSRDGKGRKKIAKAAAELGFARREADVR